MSEKIKQCPYCGSEEGYVDGFLGRRKVVCGCGATGPGGKTDADAILLWNAAANALEAKDAEIADAKRRIYDGDMRVVKLEAEITELQDEIKRLNVAWQTSEFGCTNLRAERDEARKVAKHWYIAAKAWMKNCDTLLDALPTRNEPQSIRVTATSDDDN